MTLDAHPLLTTKLYAPPERPELLTRPPLIQRLQRASQQPMTLLCAPAGSGKSTLLAEWARQSKMPTAWLSLDETDNDPYQFLTYFVAAIQSVHGQFGEPIVVALNSRQQPPLPTLLPLLLNEISALDKRTVLVLDDYHIIHSQPIHSGLTFLLSHIPPTLHLVISSRADPPLPLARLRVQGQLCELRSADLCFESTEITTFIRQIQALPLSDEQLAILEERTEGWAAGLQLASLSMNGRTPEQIDQFVTTFSGDHRYIFDYLAEEVLTQCPKGTYQFLLQTSILSRLTAPLCAALIGENDCQAVLEELDQTNLFLIRLDDHRHWYRYHHLFAEFLEQRLVEEMPDLVRQLHQRAMIWYQDKNMLLDAIHHGLAGEAWATAAEMIEEAAWQLRARGEYTRLRTWMRRFPDEFIYAHPHLSSWYGFALTMSGELQAAEKPLQIAVAGFNDTENRLELAEILLTQMQIANFRRLGEVSVALARQARDLLVEDDQEMLLTAYFGLGRGLELLGQIDEARQALQKAEALSIQTENLVMTLLVVSTLGAIEQWQGRLHQAYARFQQCLDHQSRFDHIPIAAASLRVGSLLYEWNRLAEATQQLQAGIEIARRQDREQYWPAAHLHLARTYWAQNDFEQGEQAIQQAVTLATNLDNPNLLQQIEAYQVRGWMFRGNYQAAGEWLAQHDLSVSDLEIATPTEQFHQQTLYLTWVRWLIATDQGDEALLTLEVLIKAATAQSRTGDFVQMWGLQALAHQALESPSDAQQSLHKALTQAAPEGYIRTFVDMGKPIEILLHQYDASDEIQEYITTVLAAFDDGSSKSTLAVPNSLTSPHKFLTSEILSDRELEIMHLVANGLTAPQMANELIVSVHTMRTHLKNIYRKLEVNSRVQALEKARALGLL